jgi:hypothetical protein
LPLEPSVLAALDLPGVEDMDNLREMMVWMEAALGDTRYFVSLDDMVRFKRGWERAFPVSSTAVPTTDSGQLQQQLLLQQQQQQPDSQGLARDD